MKRAKPSQIEERIPKIQTDRPDWSLGPEHSPKQPNLPLRTTFEGTLGARFNPVSDRLSQRDRAPAQRTVERTGQGKRPIASLRNDGSFERFGLSLMFGIVIAVVAYGWAKFALCLF